MIHASVARSTSALPSLALCIAGAAAPFALGPFAPIASQEGASPEVAADATNASTGPAFRPAELRPALDDPDVALPIALHLARGGDADSGAARLAELEAGLADDEARRRVAAERERMEEWIATRDRFLAQVAERDGNLIVRLGDKRRRLDVERFEDGVVHFEPNRWDIESRPANQIDPLYLAREMGKDGRGFEAGWIRLWVYALCDDDRWDRLLDGSSEEVTSFREHARDYPTWLARGAVHADLLALSELEPPADAEGAEAIGTRIHSVAEAHAGNPAFEEVRDAIADLAEAAAFVALGEASIDELFAGEAEDLDDGRVRLGFDFDSATELDAFERGTYSRTGEGFDLDAEACSEFRVEGGELILEGRGCLRTHLEFEGPIDVTYTYAMLEMGPGMGIALGVHDDGEGNLIRAEGVMGLVWVDVDADVTPPMASDMAGQVGFMENMDYDVRLSLDEEGTCTLARDGTTMAQLEDCPRERGAVFLSKPVDGDGKLAVSELVVEARLTDDALHGLRLDAARRAADDLRAP